MINFNEKVLFLAPLAGYSDVALRGVVKKFGCDVTVSEMISSNALVYESAKTLDMIKKNPLEQPYIVQIAASEPAIAQKAVLILNKIDEIDGIDLNCGCPVPKVVRQNAGSALLNNPNLLCQIIQTIKKYSNKTYTSVKIRLGFNEKNAYKIVKDIENAGADYIAVHGRTRAGGYSSIVDYESIAMIKELVKIPVIANGDIDQQNISEVLNITKCNGAMIGRACIGRPWIFYEIKNNQKISQTLKKEIILEHFAQMLNHYKDKAVMIFKKHLHEYSKGMDGASNFRNLINKIDDPLIMQKQIENFF